MKSTSRRYLLGQCSSKVQVQYVRVDGTGFEGVCAASQQDQAKGALAKEKKNEEAVVRGVSLGGVSLGMQQNARLFFPFLFDLCNTVVSTIDRWVGPLLS